MNDNKERKTPHHPLPFGHSNDPNNPRRVSKKRWILWILLLSVIMMTGLCSRRTRMEMAVMDLDYDGVTISQKQGLAPTKITFGMQVQEVQNLLGKEDLVDDGLYVYARLGLSLYFDSGVLRMIAGFSNSTLNPANMGTTWQVDNIRIDAGMFGSSFAKAIKNLSGIATWQDQKEDMASFGIKSNTLQLYSDQRDRVVVVIYRYQNFTIDATI